MPPSTDRRRRIFFFAFTSFFSQKNSGQTGVSPVFFSEMHENDGRAIFKENFPLSFFSRCLLCSLIRENKPTSVSILLVLLRRRLIALIAISRILKREKKPRYLRRVYIFPDPLFFTLIFFPLSPVQLNEHQKEEGGWSEGGRESDRG